ncbi:hypothetical protein NW752_000360 [Fusarium irregulare]|uniref:Uncharacterized protein n=1 Tax=Fusarium irregulare TaxID=2494466 RepID=A0A9W8PYB4_9HYPO|nr:hypothetical protein NW766_001471 [Fusarium irregulare]KAJ4028103.1 hypothetical protein NW752_000360 [Fusarium irregulare]
MVGYKDHASYKAYLNNGERPDERLLPPLATNSAGSVVLNPGELYCRFRYNGHEICSESHQFSSESALRNHYKNVHQVIPEERRSGRLKRSVENDMIRWYSALGANIQHNWVPRKAKVRGYSPEPQPSPSLRSLQDAQEPAPIFGPQAAPAENGEAPGGAPLGRGRRPRRRLTRAQRRRRREQLQAAEGPRSSEDPVKNEDPEDLM